MSDLKISISGIRGIVGDSLTEDITKAFSSAFAVFLGSGKVLVGSDTRASSNALKNAALNGILLSNCIPVDLGICPTPTVSTAVRELKASGGIVITASHNPPQWNGLKFFDKDGTFIKKEALDEILKIYNSKILPNKTLANKTIEKENRALQIHIEKVLKEVDVKSIEERKFRVALDSVNGAGGKITKLLLSELGCEIFDINTSETSPFPHPAEPTAENIKELCALTKSKKADIGFAQDPDADRLSIVSKQGIAIGEEYTLALAADHLLSKLKNKMICTNLSTSMLIDDVAKRHGAKVIRTRIGEANVYEAMKKYGAQLGGEGNGGIIYTNISFCRDSLCGIAIILEYLARTGKSISEIVDELPKYHMIKDKVSVSTNEEVVNILSKVKELYKNDNIDQTDGIKINLKDAFLHVRASNTEPIIRIMAEAKDKRQAEKLIEGISRLTH